MELMFSASQRSFFENTLSDRLIQGNQIGFCRWGKFDTVHATTLAPDQRQLVRLAWWHHRLQYARENP